MISLRLHDMMQIGAAEIAAGGAAAAGIERRGIVGISRIAQIERPIPGESLAVAARARGQHAIEHVDAAQHRADDIVRLAHAHQIARPVGRQMRHGRVQRLEHRGLAFAHREPAHRITVKADLDAALPPNARADAGKTPPCTMPKQAWPGCSPNAALERLAQRIESASDFSISASRRGKGGAFVQHHLDVGAQQALDFHRAFGREKFLRAVDMRLEAHALFGDLAQLRQRHHLEAAGIGEDRPLPAHEFVQARPAARCVPRRAAASDDRCCREEYRRRSRARLPAASP